MTEAGTTVEETVETETVLTPEQQAELDAANDAAADEAPAEAQAVIVIPEDDAEQAQKIKADLENKLKDADEILNKEIGPATRTVVEEVGEFLITMPDKLRAISRKCIEARHTIPRTVASAVDGVGDVVVHDWTGVTGSYTRFYQTFVVNVLDKLAPMGEDGKPDMETTRWIEAAKRGIQRGVIDQMKSYLTEHGLLAEADHLGLDLRTIAEREAERRNRQRGSSGGGSTERGLGNLSEIAEKLAADADPERVFGSAVTIVNIGLDRLVTKDENNRTGLERMTPQARREMIAHLDTLRGSYEKVLDVIEKAGVKRDGQLTPPKEVGVQVEQTAPATAPTQEAVTA